MRSLPLAAGSTPYRRAAFPNPFCVTLAELTDLLWQWQFGIAIPVPTMWGERANLAVVPCCWVFVRHSTRLFQCCEASTQNIQYDRVVLVQEGCDSAVLVPDVPATHDGIKQQAFETDRYGLCDRYAQADR